MAPSNSKFNIELLKQLSAAIDDEAESADFACGGSIPVTAHQDQNIGSTVGLVNPPVTLRWDLSDNQSAMSKVTFPVQSDDEAASASFNALIDRCQPATFGADGKDVLDETYRKAGKLDNETFCTDFHPHDCGIVDAIQQILLPCTVPVEQLGLGNGSYGVRAELYKLNVYSAPSGKFQAHVDTPRGPQQFGSLVVCLPYAHEGGTLRVKHHGQTTDFAWGERNPQSISWAAFFGDCEHEVLEVTKGHRVTLTYNLYRTSSANLARPAADPERLPLYGKVKELLEDEAFLPRGGTLGFFCNHQYAHAHDAGRKSVPAAFKGVDLAIFTTFHSLGLKPTVRPVLRDDSHRDPKWGGLSVEELFELEDVDEFDKKMNATSAQGEDRDEDMSEEDEDMSDEDEYRSDEHDDRTRVGTNMHGLMINRNYEEEASTSVDQYSWPHKKVAKIIWLNGPSWEEFAHFGVVYGNQAELDWSFSAATILVVIPPYAERARKTTGATDEAIVPGSGSIGSVKDPIQIQ